MTVGDNQKFEVLKKANLDEDLNVEMMVHIECLSQVAKRMKTNLCKRQEKILKDSRTSKAGAKKFYQENLAMTERVTQGAEGVRGDFTPHKRTIDDWDS